MAEREKNGLCVEKKLIEGLRQMGFRTQQSGQVLDEDFKIDAIIEAPPLIPGTIFFPPVVGLQVTLQRENGGKRGRFLREARKVVPRLVYLELAVEEVTPPVIHAAAAALASVFFDEGPAYRLIVVGENFFEMFDLEKEDKKYREWLAKKIPGIHKGRVVKWLRNSRYGYIEAVLPGAATKVDIYFRASDIKNPELLRRLDENDGPLRNRAIRVTFRDGGASGDQNNKNAHDVCQNDAPAHKLADIG